MGKRRPNDITFAELEKLASVRSLAPTRARSGRFALVTAFRREAPGVAADQWRRFFEGGRFAKNVPAAEEAASPALRHAKAVLGAARLQMLRYHVPPRCGTRSPGSR